jgi:3-phenylpropionate/cinnamic acid dioxygenase small subunit
VNAIARLLDEHKLEEWLDLFTDDVLRIMPRRKNVLRGSPSAS